MTTSTGGWLGGWEWKLRPEAHGGQEIHEAVLFELELDRIKGRASSDPAQVLEIRRHRAALMDHHLVWRHAPAYDRDAWLHVLPGERKIRELVGRSVIALALFWLRRRGLERGLLECMRYEWRWAWGDFHHVLADRIHELEGQHARELAATVDRVRQGARREVLEELRTMAEARRGSSSGVTH